MSFLLLNLYLIHRWLSECRNLLGFQTSAFSGFVLWVVDYRPHSKVLGSIRHHKPVVKLWAQSWRPPIHNESFSEDVSIWQTKMCSLLTFGFWRLSAYSETEKAFWSIWSPISIMVLQLLNYFFKFSIGVRAQTVLPLFFVEHRARSPENKVTHVNYIRA